MPARDDEQDDQTFQGEVGWPTPMASNVTGAGTSGRGGGLNLQTAVQLASPKPEQDDQAFQDLVARYGGGSKMAVHNSSVKQDWRTPTDLIRKLTEALGPIALDPCAADDAAHHLARFNITKADDGLTQPWHVTAPYGWVYVNSEYGTALPKWVAKCAREVEQGAEIVQLTPARPGTRWYRAAKAGAQAICELHKRLTFQGAPDPAPFPSTLFYYGPRPFLFCHLFQHEGDVRPLII